MIETALETSTTEEQPSLGPVFMVKSPAINPFVVAGPVAFVKTDNKLDLEWTRETDSPSSQAAAELAEEFVSRCKREVQRHPDSPRAFTNLGAALMTSGDVDEAIKAFQAALKLERFHYPALAHLANARLLREELSEAERLAVTLKEHFPRDSVASLMLGWIAVRQGRAVEAIREITIAAKLDEKSALPHYLLGMVLLSLHRDQDAIAHLRKATKLDSRSPALQRGLGVAYALRGDLRRAIRALRTSLALDSNAPETVHALGRVLMQKGDTESAVHLLAAFVERNPHDRLAQELLAQGYKKQEQHRSVKRHLQRALESFEKDDSPEAKIERARLMNNIGVACASFGTLDEAERWYKQALETSAHPISFRNLFGVYSERQNKAAAKLLLSRWLETFPDDDYATLQSAVQQAEGDNLARGLNELRRLTQSPTVSARAYSVLGYFLSDHVRDLDAAIAVLQEGYDKFPGDPGIANNLAYVYLMAGSPSKARPVLERVAPEDVTDSIYLIATWGLLYLWEGDLTNAHRQYAQAAELARRNGRRDVAQTARQKMHLEFGRHYLRTGDSVRANKEIKAGLELEGSRTYKEDLRTMDKLLAAGERVEPPKLTGGGGV